MATLEEQNADSFKRSADAAEALVLELRSEHAQLVELWQTEIDALPTREQKLYLSIFQFCLQVRLGPAVISSGTSDIVVDDLVRDAARMATLSWSIVGPQLLALAGDSPA